MRGIRAKQLRCIAYGRDGSTRDTTYHLKPLKRRIDPVTQESKIIRGMYLCAPARRAYKDAKKAYMNGTLNVVRNKALCLKEMHG